MKGVVMGYPYSLMGNSKYDQNFSWEPSWTS